MLSNTVIWIAFGLFCGAVMGFLTGRSKAWCGIGMAIFSIVIGKGAAGLLFPVDYWGFSLAGTLVVVIVDLIGGVVIGMILYMVKPHRPQNQQATPAATVTQPTPGTGQPPRRRRPFGPRRP